MNASASLIFVKFFLGTAKASGKPFQMLELSDGIKSKSFFVKFDDDQISYCEKIERGEKVIVKYSTDLFDERNPIVIDDIEVE